MGHVTLMTALAYSLNTISVQIAVQVGLDRIIEIMRGFGIASPIPRHISISLGTPDLTPLERASKPLREGQQRVRAGRIARHHCLAPVAEHAVPA